MSKELNELLNLLQLEQLELDLFRGQSENLGLPQVYGGQVIGQSLSAAKQTVEKERFYIHSIAIFCVQVTLKNRSFMM